MLKESKILEKSIIIIEYKDGVCKPYYVNTKWIGAVTGTTMLLGYLIDDLVSNVKSYGLNKVWPIAGQNDCYYIDDNRVKNYRLPTEQEKSEIKELLQSVKLHEIAATLIMEKYTPLSINEIKEKKIIVITDNDNQRTPFYVAIIDTKETIIMGLPVENIIKDNLWPIKFKDCFINNNLVAGEVKFSKLTTTENLKLKVILLNNKLSEVAAFID